MASDDPRRATETCRPCRGTGQLISGLGVSPTRSSARGVAAPDTGSRDRRPGRPGRGGAPASGADPSEAEALTMALKLTTAGESHGPGLTCIVEGLPAGLELDRDGAGPGSGAPPARPRPWRADEDRARPGRRHRRRAARPHARRPDRAAGGQPRLRQLGGADEPVAGRAPPRPRCISHAPVTPTSSAPRSTG